MRRQAELRLSVTLLGNFDHLILARALPELNYLLGVCGALSGQNSTF